MARVTALFRHPVKGFTPEALPVLEVQADGRIRGDRTLAFRFADAVEPEARDGLEYWPKTKGLALQDFPALAQLRLTVDDEARRITIRRGENTLVEAGLDDAGREALVAAVTAFVRDSPQGPRLEHAGRLPLTLLGDGVTSRFQDDPRGYVSLHATASVAALAAALGSDSDSGSRIDDRRFRSNVVVDGFSAWEELEWEEGREIRIGDVRFRADIPIVRCLATHADPDTGERNVPVLTTLTRNVGQQRPTLGRMLLPIAGGGTIRVGDTVSVI
ncbi:molybdenum cofactor sulfurase [Leucobacter sp. Psy1]|uniref:MOSC domain-containing protein n=1 Tax=Leucobacter sp. Psy1 TaxID=2875729 RepID=UPI001CD5F59D|nr:MOSC domain-containing protein [Leucobacter sp. Psy1]UBH04677.1 molybdenum cofactor sulfurase [Leucobacter sp. Psy1]